MARLLGMAMLMVAVSVSTLAAQTTRPREGSGANAPTHLQARDTAAEPEALDQQLIRKPGTSSPSAEPGSVQDTQGSWEPWRVILALCVVVALIFALRWIARRLFLSPGGARASKAVQVLSRSTLSPKQQVVLLRVGKRVIVIADSGARMNTLCEITDPDEVARLVGELPAEHADSGRFGAVFNRLRSGYDQSVDEDAPETPAAEAASSPIQANTEDASDASATCEELNGLMEKVRLVARQFGRT